jgi:orotidine-5'-phosphate decarboxylase
MHKTSRILLPLDTNTADRAIALAAQLKDEVAGFKVGLELINSAGFEIFDRLSALGLNIFYDCKYHDIPNTVAGAARAAGRRGLWMFNIHASGGSTMLKAAVKGAEEGAAQGGHGVKPLVIAVTVLTSIDQPTLTDELGVGRTVEQQVIALAKLAQDAGCDGVVASAHEIGAIRAACGPDFKLVIPGIRPAGSDVGDQKRVMTPAEAVDAGADYLVIGRPIYAAADPLAVARQINAETASAA